MIVAVFISVLIFAVIVLYNGLINKKNQLKNSFSSLDVMLKKRYTLIPNLIDTVKQFTSHEKSLLLELTELRTKSTLKNLSQSEKLELNNHLDQSLGKIMVQVENYPDITSNHQFIQLQRSLNEVEEQISAARRSYNASVKDFNNGIEMFPTNILASLMTLTPEKFLINKEHEQHPIDIDASFNS
jgi:LemA protein